MVNKQDHRYLSPFWKLSACYVVNPSGICTGTHIRYDKVGFGINFVEILPSFYPLFQHQNTLNCQLYLISCSVDEYKSLFDASVFFQIGISYAKHYQQLDKIVY